MHFAAIYNITELDGVISCDPMHCAALYNISELDGVIS